MMTDLQFYLLKLMEECNEVAQNASKTMQFTLDEVMKGQPLSNRQRVHAELDDVMAVIEELNARGLDYTPDPERIAAKKVKMRRYRQYSEELGTVERSNDQNDGYLFRGDTNGIY